MTHLSGQNCNDQDTGHHGHRPGAGQRAEELRRGEHGGHPKFKPKGVGPVLAAQR